MARPTNILKSPISLAIADLRTHLGETQELFARRMRVSPVTIARWESSKPPRGSTLKRLFLVANRNGAKKPAIVLQRAIERATEKGYLSNRLGEILEWTDLRGVRDDIARLWDLVTTKSFEPVEVEDMEETILRLAGNLLIDGEEYLKADDVERSKIQRSEDLGTYDDNEGF